MNNSELSFARVVIPSPLNQPLTYSIPAELRDRVKAGMRVSIPLGRRIVMGVVFDMLETTPLLRTRSICGVLDDVPVIDAALMALVQWTAQYYLASLGEILAVILPRALRREIQRTVMLLEPAPATEDMTERRVIELLRQRKRAINVKTLTECVQAQNLEMILERLCHRGVISIGERRAGKRQTRSLPSWSSGPPSATGHTGFTPTAAQTSALAAIEARLRRGGFEVFLLHGVTGSGKTEVYLRAMEQTRAAGLQSLILIPEISLTPQLIDRLSARLPGRVGVLHSGLTGSERWLQWWRILRGEVDVVIGARSAVFAPLPRLGLIIVDEEHDPSYKQEEGVRYNGRDVAVVRGKQLACPVILGSATPAIESYENARQGRYRLLEMRERVEARPLPPIEIVDLRGRARTGASLAHPLISSELADALSENYHKSRQSLIFLNRRGFANFLLCRGCGHILRCGQCSVTLTLHLRQRSLCCHHCNFRRPVPELCPACGNAELGGIGSGTEQIEQALLSIVPGARIARMDRDTTSKRGSQESLLRSWEKGEIDILVGTQMITKGHDVSGVTLVGALLADMSLNVPDFRAAERTFQLLSQVAGRAGRGEDAGRVIVQTYTPEHYTMRHLLQHDYRAFFEEELGFRRALNYPPFGRLVSMRIEGAKSDVVESKAKQLAQGLRAIISGDSKLRKQIEILGPAPAPIIKLRNRYRWQMLLKGIQSNPLLKLAAECRKLLPRSSEWRLHIDVDPHSML
jgi:primosomal protein N' (replication factor Y)